MPGGSSGVWEAPQPPTTGTAAICFQASTAPGQAPNVQAHDPWALPSAGTRLDA